MFKKAVGLCAALAFVFSLAPHASFIATSVSGACSYVCLDHDGDVWDN